MDTHTKIQFIKELLAVIDKYSGTDRASKCLALLGEDSGGYFADVVVEMERIIFLETGETR